MSKDLIRVHSVQEEYFHLLVTPCASCGRGPLAPAMIELTQIKGKPVDMTTTICQSCGQRVVFHYDISGFYDTGDEAPVGLINPTTLVSAAVDLYGWESVARMLSQVSQEETDPAKARQFALEAQQCIAEALKFYNDDEDFPPESAFWSADGVKAFAASPKDYSKQALMDLRASLPMGTGTTTAPVLTVTETVAPAVVPEKPPTTTTPLPAKKGIMGLFKK